MNRESYRLHLEGLTDRELIRECQKTLDLDLDRPVEERDRLTPPGLPSAYCYWEAVRRRMPELWRDALASVKAERAAVYSRERATV